eukprot:224190-Hanusia_phi.AAC.1
MPQYYCVCPERSRGEDRRREEKSLERYMTTREAFKKFDSRAMTVRRPRHRSHIRPHIRQLASLHSISRPQTRSHRICISLYITDMNFCQAYIHGGSRRTDEDKFVLKVVLISLPTLLLTSK